MNPKKGIFIRIGRNIRRLRMSQGTSQRLFAANVGIDERHLRRIEKGVTNPTLGTLIEIADELKIEVTNLLEDRK